ncbi:hypothetical protein [Candidatus Magnetobacterium casense]|uniref:Uncharacterized protein n=1 Tax=Candidatus Magnetobacterium casense TaxID=1455061 RepID=A0ABS6S0F8_9BACT|nr:hypothetical protein [Candidatus Magnetobacterium casensis]MBV6342346.1 hypothetical protein [Candidatus Magnetobacterium casensis]
MTPKTAKVKCKCGAEIAVHGDVKAIAHNGFVTCFKCGAKVKLEAESC